MRSAKAKINVDRSPAEVYAYLIDYASRSEFAPKVYRELRLARIESEGLGAGGRFRLHRKLRDRYAGTTVTEAVVGERILEEGSTGRGGRVGMAAEFLLEELPGGTTSLTWVIETYPGNFADRLREFGMRGQIRRQMRRSIRRLRAILEEAPDALPGERPTVGGLDPVHVPNP
jgi:hypothetical protein